jgi:hypothetical protein
VAGGGASARAPPGAHPTTDYGNRFATVKYGLVNELVDAAIARLDEGTKWLAEIEGIGPVAGDEHVTAARLLQAQRQHPQRMYIVRKRGRSTRITSAYILRVNYSGEATYADGTVHRKFKDQMLIRGLSSSPLPFALKGDSGSAVVNSKRQVVGSLTAATYDAKDRPNGGVVVPIEFIKKKLHVEIATSTRSNQVRTVPASSTKRAGTSAASASSAGLGCLVLTERQLEALVAAKEELSQTAGGRRVLALVLRHHYEVREMFDSNRRAAAVWHRNGGPAILKQGVQALQSRDTPLPATVEGKPLAECLSRILDVLARYGSAELAAAVEAHRREVLALCGLSFGQIAGRLAAAGAGA